MAREIVRERLSEDDIFVLIAVAEKADEYVRTDHTAPLMDLCEKVEELREGVWVEVES